MLLFIYAASGAAISPRGFQSPKSNHARTGETEEPLELIAIRTERDVVRLREAFCSFLIITQIEFQQLI